MAFLKLNSNEKLCIEGNKSKIDLIKHCLLKSHRFEGEFHYCEAFTLIGTIVVVLKKSIEK